MAITNQTSNKKKIQGTFLIDGDRCRICLAREKDFVFLAELSKREMTFLVFLTHIKSQQREYQQEEQKIFSFGFFCHQPQIKTPMDRPARECV